MIGRELENYVDDFVGHHVTVRKSSNALNEGMEGTVIDETKNMLVIKTPTGAKKIQKNGLFVDIDTRNGRITLDMSVIAYRSEDRIKNYIKIARKIRKNHLKGNENSEERVITA